MFGEVFKFSLKRIYRPHSEATSMVNKGENNPAKAGFIDFFEKTT
jgi:hypothetical protein